MAMLFRVDTQYGHVVEDTPEGPVYQDDRSKVEPGNPRPCFGCAAKITPGSHDPCIANLPGTYQACCGHGRELTPNGNLPGYAALKDGRFIRFSGCVGGARIREAIELALRNEPLPEGFAVDADRAWWEGLTDAQREYVQSNVPRGLAELVEQVTGAPASPAFLAGEAPWWEGLTDVQKGLVWNSLKGKLAELVQEALQKVPSEPQ